MEINNQIKTCTQDGNDFRMTYMDGKCVTVPVSIGGRPIPLKDPYNPSEDNGCMVANKIIKSGLSIHAKMAYTVLRANIYYGTGFSFITMETLAKGMSCHRKTALEAIKELEQHKVISVERRKRKGLQKNYYAMRPTKDWDLPDIDKKKAMKLKCTEAKSYTISTIDS